MCGREKAESGLAVVAVGLLGGWVDEEWHGERLFGATLSLLGWSVGGTMEKVCFWRACL